ncbi:MAG: DUF2309 domain-containing protein [Myxococcota bacterium]
MSLAPLFRTDSADPAIEQAIEAACARIAPSWPLDQSIAVNPLWGWTADPVPKASRRIEALAGSRLLMPRSWYAGQWHAGRLRESHLRAALEACGETESLETLVAHLLGPETPPARRALVTDVADGFRDTVHGVAWCDFVAHTLSQHCAAFFDAGQARLGPDRRGGLYPAWRRAAHHDWSPRLLMGLKDYRALLEDLPADPFPLIAETVALLGVPAFEREAYFTALLMRVNGWAAWCAHRRFVARRAGGDDDQIVHLLALRMAWESILYRGGAPGPLSDHWSAAVAAWRYADRTAEAAQRLDWVLQRALELAHQSELAGGLARAGAGTPAAATPVPAVQIAFCIDVRSEVFRRALEAVAPSVETLGFAGFFGAPIEYQPLGSATARPQLPGPLAPAMRATDQGAPADLAARRGARLARQGAWKELRQASVSAFSFVESAGWLAASSLLGLSLRRGRPGPQPESAGLTGAEKSACKPRIAGPVAGGELTRTARVELAAGILRAMSLPSALARLVVLAGHGSQTLNNPHAAALDCGACCGETGEVNARAVAALLNDAAVRSDLADRGLAIPDETRFVAALHDTTVDRVALFDLDELPASHAADVAALRGWLEAAGVRARRERAPTLGLAALADDPAALEAAVGARARDWSEVRPEWGLANNAAFVVAPRSRTRSLDLAGRSFLHEYRWEQDRDFSVLELILTAPMVVTHWINFQYYASTVDNRRWGSGDKTLHNVVGARLGVFEGNGGDLRIGLSLQSLHDGRQWRHTPLRLSVYVEAPREAIDAILAKHERVRQLVENEWLFLLQIDSETGGVMIRRPTGWQDFAPVAAAAAGKTGVAPA